MTTDTDSLATRDPAAGTAPAVAPAGPGGREFAFERFFLPGPTAVRPEVLDAMRGPMMGHRGEEMKSLLGSLQPGLRRLFGTGRPVFVSTSSATGLMEAAVSSLSRRRILCLVCGAFSGRFRTIADRLGRPADSLEVAWGEPSLPERLADRLSDDPRRYDLVTAVHSETSTGVLNPVRELAEVVSDFDGVLLAVDGVSSVAGVPVGFDDWGVDFFLTGSQKALALPPGLALGVTSERALARAREVPERSRYFDLTEFDRRIRNDQTPNTPVIPLLYALRHQLDRFEEEGLDARFQRHRAMAERTHGWVEETASRTEREFEVLAPEGYRSPTVTAVRLPDGVSGREVAAGVRERGYTIAPGYGKLKEETVRIGHMGDHTAEELEGVLQALTDELEART